MAFIVKTDSYTKNAQRITVMLDLVNEQLRVYSNICFNVKPTNSIGVKDESLNRNADDEKIVLLCNNIKKVKTYEEIVSKVSAVPEVLSECMQYVVSYGVNTATDFIIKKIQICAIHIKQFLNDVTLASVKLIKKCILGINDKCGSAITAALNASTMVLMQVFKALAQGVYFVMMGIKTVLDVIPTFLAVEAEGMCFFPTPKSIIMSMGAVKMTCANPNQSITDRLTTTIKMTISDIEEAVNKINNQTRVAMIAAGGALGLACAYTELKLPDNFCKGLEIINPKNIIKAINNVLSLLPVPDALPKYEKLTPINLGYLAWLITGFCPAGKKAFGFPGFP